MISTSSDTSQFNASQFYHKHCTQLAKSIILKSNATAVAMNNEVNRRFGGYAKHYQVNELYPESWRYYHHLQGKYHYSDVMMQVRSLDTLQTIDFTKENLEQHRATWLHYKNKGEFYQELVDRYPDQHLLIDGICKPIDFNKAYEAEEYSILGYDETLVEEQEVDLIPMLNSQIVKTAKRFHSRGYGAFDPLYNAMKLGVIAQHLPGMIIALREQFVKTEQAHSFHIWNYLDSYFDLGKYKRFLTFEQAMWLYRHLPYIDRHNGKQNTFDDLIEWMLTKRQIPLYNYRLGRDTDGILEGIDKPDIYRDQLNLKQFEFKSDNDHIDFEKLVDKENGQGARNSYFRNAGVWGARDRYYRSRYSNQKTKVLESEVIDYGNHKVKSFTSLLMNYWAHLSTSDRYPLVGAITNPISGEPINLAARDGFILWIYCALKLSDNDDQMADHNGKWIMPTKVENMPIPTVIVHDIVWSRVSWDILKNERLDQRADITDAVNDLQDYYPYKGIYYSVDRFREFVMEVQQYFGRIRHWLGVHQDLLHYGEVKQLGELLFFQQRVPLVKVEQTFAQYFKQNNWEIDGLTREQIASLATNLYGVFTGGSAKDSVSITEVQEAMMALLKQLSSYSIQYTYTAGNANARVLDSPWLHYGRIITYKRNKHHLLRHWLVKWKPLCTKAKDKIGLNAIYTNQNTKLICKAKDTILIPPPVKFNITNKGFNRHTGPLGLVGFRRIRSTTNHNQPYYYYIHNGTIFKWFDKENPESAFLDGMEGKRGTPPTADVAYRVVDGDVYPVVDEGLLQRYYCINTPSEIEVHNHNNHEAFYSLRGDGVHGEHQDGDGTRMFEQPAPTVSTETTPPHHEENS